jgi:AraC-like DNA-binding protein
MAALSHQPNIPMRLTKEDVELLDQAKALLDNTIKILPLSEISQQLYVSQARLTALFKKKFNSTVYKYHLKKRMEYARNELENNGVMIKELAQVLGYSDSKSFNHAFHNIYGKPPERFKKDFGVEKSDIHETRFSSSGSLHAE